MSSSMSQLEDAVFQSIVPQLEADGYHVFIHPSRTMLPPFLQSYQPDAVAYKGDRRIAIEVVGGAARHPDRDNRLQSIFSGHPDWELRLIYAPPRVADEPIPVSTPDEVEQRLQQIEGSIDAMGDQAALLSTWSAFEAAARALIPDQLRLPQNSGRLLQALASEGYITPDQADSLRHVSKVRNAVAHGRLDLMPARAMIQTVIDATRAMLVPEPS